jgi:hypothetical protein
MCKFAHPYVRSCNRLLQSCTSGSVFLLFSFLYLLSSLSCQWLNTYPLVAQVTIQINLERLPTWRAVCRHIQKQCGSVILVGSAAQYVYRDLVNLGEAAQRVFLN